MLSRGVGCGEEILEEILVVGASCAGSGAPHRQGAACGGGEGPCWEHRSGSKVAEHQDPSDPELPEDCQAAW